MLRNYIKIAWRNLLRGKVFNAINIFGLTVAIACSTLLFLTVDYEFSYDRFHENIDEIHQVYFTSNKASGQEKDTPMPEPITPALKAEYPNIRHISRMGNGGALIRYKDKQIDKSLMYVDESFQQIFSIPLVKGEKKRMLYDLHSVVLNEQVAKAIFGNEEPVGKSIELNYTGNGYERFVVSAISKDMTWNSSLQFDMLIRFENYRDYQKNLDQWDVHNHSVYLLLNKGTDAKVFEKTLISFANKHFKESIANMKRDGAQPDASGQVFTINLLPFSQVHFNTDIGGLDGNPVSHAYILTLLTIGIFILLIACINFINLNVARAFNRAREIGVRKTLGASKTQLLSQFCIETLFICLIALMCGLLLSSWILPGFKTMFGSRISLGMLLQPVKLLSAAGLFLLITCIAGFYPAWLMLRYKTVQVLKGNVNTTKPGNVRNFLLVTQFALSTLLIICTLVIWQQMQYMQNIPLGYNRTEVISIPLGADVMMTAPKANATGTAPGKQALQLLRNKLQGQTGIAEITAAHANIGLGQDGSTSTQSVSFEYQGREIGTNWLQVEYDYLNTLDIKLLEGRDFSRNFSTDSNALIINQQMAKQLGGKNLIGTYLPVNSGQEPMPIVGIIKDYNFQSLRKKVEPLTLVMNVNKSVKYVFIRVKPTNLVQSMDQIKSSWKELFPNAEFRGSWLSENTERQYRREKNLGNMFISGAVVAILISCIGLLAIVMMVMVQRTKEIGIRKVLGSSISGIVVLLSGDFLKMVVLASVISFPVAWYVMDYWLQDFAYRITISWWIFVLAVSITLLITLITISFQAINAALANPVKSLRTE